MRLTQRKQMTVAKIGGNQITLGSQVLQSWRGHGPLSKVVVPRPMCLQYLVVLSLCAVDKSSSYLIQLSKIGYTTWKLRKKTSKQLISTR